MDAWMSWPALMPGLVALGVALSLALAGRVARRPGIASLAAAGGLLAGWWWTMGLVTASPRQLPERLPLLAAALLLLAALGGMASRRGRWVGPVVAALGVLAAGWWMAGAPRTAADAVAALPSFAGVAALAALMLHRPAAWSAAAAALALLAALLLARLPGPAVVLAMAVAGAALGTLASGQARPGSPVAAMPLAAGMAALAALPVLARGALADWAVAAVPASVLWAGALPGLLPSLRLPAPVAAALVALACLGAVWLLR